MTKRIGSSHPFQEELRGILTFVGAIWIVYLISSFAPGLKDYGLRARSLPGIIGILTMPFLHDSLGHIVSNTVPLLLLLGLLAGSRANSASIVLLIVVTGGALLWAFSFQQGGSQGAMHIGASGLVYGLITFLICSGFLERRPIPLIVAVIVLVMYGLSTSIWLGMLPASKVSWDGHLYGAVAGVLVAFSLNASPDKNGALTKDA